MRFLLAFFLLIFSEATAFTIDEKLENQELESRAVILFDKIRCVVCTGQSLKESDVEMARTLRKIIRDKVKQGLSNEEILSFLKSRYGDHVVLEPEFNAEFLLLWLFPLTILIGGLIILRRCLRIPHHKANNTG